MVMWKYLKRRYSKIFFFEIFSLPYFRKFSHSKISTYTVSLNFYTITAMNVYCRSEFYFAKLMLMKLSKHKYFLHALNRAQAFMKCFLILSPNLPILSYICTHTLYLTHNMWSAPVSCQLLHINKAGLHQFG